MVEFLILMVISSLKLYLNLYPSFYVYVNPNFNFSMWLLCLHCFFDTLNRSFRSLQYLEYHFLQIQSSSTKIQCNFSCYLEFYLVSTLSIYILNSLNLIQFTIFKYIHMPSQEFSFINLNFQKRGYHLC